MKYTVSMIILLNSFLLFSQTPSNDPHWQLVWQDNFSYFDNTKWIKAHYCDHGEPQLYLEQNVWTSGGNLVIKVDNNSAYCPSNPPNPTTWACGSCNTGTHNYTSGWEETKQAYNTQYGYIESRIKLPYRYGFWPAFWTWRGRGVTTTNEAEIDIFEMLGSSPQAPNIVGTNIHREYCDQNQPDYPVCANIPDYGQDLIPTNFNYTNWHTYGLEWSPSKIIWYVDGCPARILPNHGIIDPVRIILNLAIEPDYLPPTYPFFTDYMYVDFVKVYNLKNDCNTNINVCNYNFGAHDNRVKRNITVGNGSCTNSLNSGDNVYLRASEGVLINGNFTVPVGAELYIDVNPCY